MRTSIGPQIPEKHLKLSEARIKDSLIVAYDNYQKAFNRGDTLDQRYWDGYIRALHHAWELGDKNGLLIQG